MNLDDLGFFDGKDLVEQFGRGWPGSFRLTGHAETQHDGVAIDLHAFDGRPDTVGQKAAVPIEDLAAIRADPGPLDLGMQKRPEQLKIEVPVGSHEVPGDIGHHPGTQ